MNRLIYGTLVICFISNCLCLAAPEPAIVPTRGQWTLDVEFSHLQTIEFSSFGAGQSRRYWYTIITLINKTEEDVDFYPICELMTDTFRIKSAGTDVSTTVFDHIKRRHINNYPFLVSLGNAGNRILQGEDNAKDIAIIWSDFDNKAESVKLFLTGFSNETAIVKQPIISGEISNQKQVYLRKTLELSYAIKGDPTSRSNVNLEFEGKRWIMR